MLTHRPAALTMAALAAALLLTGCAMSSNRGGSNPFEAAPSPTRTVAATPKPPPTPTYTAGETLSTFPATTPPAGLDVYSMSNGTYVIVSATAPLPAAVVTDIGKQVTAASAGATQANPTGGTSERAIEQAEAGTGRDLIIVRNGWSSDANPADGTQLHWLVINVTAEKPPLVFGNNPAGLASAEAAARQESAALPGSAVVVIPES